METFDFRLRFHLLERDRIEEHSEELVVCDNGPDGQLRLKAGESGVPIKDRSSAALMGGPYDTEFDARAAADRARRALLIWAVQQRVGLDLGDGRSRGGLTNYGRELLEAQVGVPIRDDIHGVDVFPHREGQKFLKLNFAASVGKSAKTFVETIATRFLQPIGVTEKQVVAAELYCSSFFDVSFRSRFITLVTAIEALLEPAERSAAATTLVEVLEDTVSGAEIDEATRAAIRGSLQWLRRDSIGQAGRHLAMRLLAGREYAGKSPSKFFAFCYEIRSQILHDGRAHDSSVDLLEAANTLNRFVADLLLASLGVSNPSDGTPAPSPSNSA